MKDSNCYHTNLGTPLEEDIYNKKVMANINKNTILTFYVSTFFESEIMSACDKEVYCFNSIHNIAHIT